MARTVQLAEEIRKPRFDGAPPRHADKFDTRFTQRFLVIAADMTCALSRGWTRPSCVAQELALRCLIDQVEVIPDLDDLDTPPPSRPTYAEAQDGSCVRYRSDFGGGP